MVNNVAALGETPSGLAWPDYSVISTAIACPPSEQKYIFKNEGL
jgi:hypothetical protein